jgi:hypothetical protein
VITKSSEVILPFGVSVLAHAIAARRVCANRSGTSSVSASNLSTSAAPVRGYVPMAGLKYRWKISPKKSYSCSLIAAPQVSDGHLNCAPESSAEQHEFGQDGGLADVDICGRGEQGEHLLAVREFAQVRQRCGALGISSAQRCASLPVRHSPPWPRQA